MARGTFPSPGWSPVSLRRSLVIAGPPGAGKTTVGARVADRLGRRFVDVDAELVRRHGPIVDQFRADGEAAFRQRERAQIVALAGVAEPLVVAVGGGAWQDAASRGALRAGFESVVLDVSIEEAMRRIGQDAARPLAGEVAARWPARAIAFRDADARLDAGQPVEVVVADVLDHVARPDVRRLRVDASNGGYDVVIRRGGPGRVGEAIAAHGLRRAVVVTSPAIADAWGELVRASIEAAGLGADLRVFPLEESTKDLAHWRLVVDELIALRVDAGTAVVALGGGVVGDVVGFAAAAVRRGVPWFAVPTTLLAMVDAAVGGKVAVNHPSGKNLVGAFHPPDRVEMAIGTLATLPPRERAAAWPEIVKTALVDGPLFARLEAEGPRLGDDRWLAGVVEACVATKARVVAADERDVGARAVLNLGHTVGHALELVSGHQIRHGEAVAMGLVAEIRAAEHLGERVADGLSERVAALLEAGGCTTEVPPWPRAALLQAMASDKKGAGDAWRWPVVDTPGQWRVVRMPFAAGEALLSW